MCKLLNLILILLLTLSFTITEAQKISTNPSKLLNTIQPVIATTSDKNSEDSADKSYLEKRLELQFNVIFENIDQGNYRGAINKIDQIKDELADVYYANYLKGKCYKALNHGDSAMYHFKQALQSKNYALLGDVRMEIGLLNMFPYLYENAAREFKIAAKLLPDNPMPLYLLGVTRIKQGHLKRSLEILEDAINLDSTYAEAYMAKVVVHMSRNRQKDAIEEMNRLIRVDSTNYRTFLLKGIICEQKNSPGDCLNSYERAAEINGEDPAVKLLLGYSLIDHGSYSRGLENLAAFTTFKIERHQQMKMKYYARDLLLDNAIVMINEQKESLDPAFVEHIARGVYEYGEDEDYAAYRELKKALDIEEIAAAHLMMGLIIDECFEVKDVEALPHFIKAAEEMKEFELLFILGDMLLTHQRAEEAVKYLKEAYEIAPDSYDIIELLANAYFLNEQYEEAITEYTKVLNVDRSNKNILISRGAAYYHAAKYEYAARDLGKAFTSDTRNYEIFEMLYKAHLMSGDTIESLRIIDTFNKKSLELYSEMDLPVDENTGIPYEPYGLKVNRDNMENLIAHVYNLKGSIYSAQKLYNKALIAYTNGIGYKSNIPAHKGKLKIMLELNQFEELLSYSDRVLNEFNNEPSALYYQGRAYIALSDEKKGNKLIQKALKKGSEEAALFISRKNN
ncbi:MAG: tetratricopeptide repeat protein [Fulvivirga sp.]|nr:tetratricopeptide repeat protein [Fulvivirga sp.]